MVSINLVNKLPGSDKDYVEGACLSTDDKPTSFSTGSIMVEVDTGKVCMFDGSSWVEQFSLQA